MVMLTPELKRAIVQAGDSPVLLTDPATLQCYVLVSAQVYERLSLDEEDRHEQQAFHRAAKQNARGRLLEDTARD